MTSPTNWRGALEMVRRTLTAVGRQQTGLYPIEGIRLHERALRAGLTFELTVLAKTLAQEKSPRLQELLTHLPPATRHLQPIPDATMAGLVDGRGLGHLISLAKIPPDTNLAEIVTAVPHPLLLVAHEVVDPGNVGAMVRTGHASGATAFIAIGVSDPYHPKAVRTSMGSLFKTAVCHYPDAANLLPTLRQLGIETVGAAASDGVPLPLATFSERGTAVFMGNEYHGLPADLLRQLDQRLTIPMSAGIDSLSVNAATAVILYEVRCQVSRIKYRAISSPDT
ncbi:MAG: RNA methyltransferase [Chloroflexi bacterium]|nr:RNA methyltransferase [Chloroflexota bacterium]GIK56693.1 MAG: tRNA/rRNA methyltransferase SpoU [Chloroflexota bacterium]